jgi:hypothetical protein
MRIIIAAAAIVAVSLMTLGSSLAQTGRYNRCVALASQQGLSAKSASGRRYINRCMQRGDYGASPSRNCPDDARARSAFPAWMCP